MVKAEAVQQMFALRKLGWGIKRIAKELKIARNTVRDWVRKGPDREYEGPRRKPLLGEHLGYIQERFQKGVRNAVVIQRELAACGVAASLRSVERAMSPLRKAELLAEQATVRFETKPGEQMQIDFGEKWLEIGGSLVKRYLFVATLGYSRRGYVEVRPHQRQRDWILGLEHAFAHFGGLTEELLVDNPKPLVLSHPRDGKPKFHPEFLAFCAHWGLRARACRSMRARTKGKVESGVKYVKRNALGGGSFASDEHLDQYLVEWTREVADRRIHGTTFEQPILRFEREKDLLRPLGNHPSYLKVWREDRTVPTDCRVNVDTNRYSVPHAFIGQTVEVVVEADLLQVQWRGRVIAEHTVHPGRHQVVEDPGHVLDLVNAQAKKQVSQDIQRPLSVYEDLVGGGVW
jgi:transposase